MPLQDGYGVLKGRVVGFRIFSKNPHLPPHLHLQVTADQPGYDVAVNIQSDERIGQDPATESAEVLFFVNHAFQPSNADQLKGLRSGLTRLEVGNELRLDFIRQHLVEVEDMTLLPVGIGRQRNDLHNELIDLAERANMTPDAVVYAFGSPYVGGDRGIHDIHMNQGNPGPQHGRDNGIFQDGALLVYFPAQERWIAAFIAFQTQSWDTDDDGKPL